MIPPGLGKKRERRPPKSQDKGSGSACSSNHPAVSGTLKGIGVRRELLDATLRFSFSVFTTEAELRYTARVLGELLPVLRRYTRR